MNLADTSDGDLTQRLKRRGWRLSAQRRVVAEVLQGEHVHLTAEDVFARAHVRLAEISQATVYNTLRELVTMGEVRVVTPPDGVKRYDPNVLVDHHHLMCMRCQLLKDVHPDGESGVTLPNSERFGFDVWGFDIIFRGVCPSCQGRST